MDAAPLSHWLTEVPTWNGKDNTYHPSQTEIFPSEMLSMYEALKKMYVRHKLRRTLRLLSASMFSHPLEELLLS